MAAKRADGFTAGFEEPVTLGGSPVCWVSMRPFTGFMGVTALAGATVEFFLRALW